MLLLFIHLGRLVASNARGGDGVGKRDRTSRLLYSCGVSGAQKWKGCIIIPMKQVCAFQLPVGLQRFLNRLQQMSVVYYVDVQ